MRTAQFADFSLYGATGDLARKISGNWLIGIRETNPAILDMFHDRDVKPYRDLLPWSGEFAGKYLTGAWYIYRLTRDQELYDYAAGFIDELLGCLDADGYIGCYQKECRLTGAFSQTPEKTGETWDAWSHYHVMLGLYLWHRQTGRRDLLGAVERIAGLFLKTFYCGNKRLSDIGSTEMNLSPLHIFALLYLETKDGRYLAFAREIEKDLSAPGAGDYVNHALSGREFYQCPKPRWESLHVIMGILKMHQAAGDEKYLEAARQIFYSILKTDVHNTGGFSTAERAVGNPYENKAIELCCVIAYNALACEMLMKTGDPRIADFLEIAHYNAVMGSYSPSGRWSTYSTPMEGERRASYHDIVFQSRPGSPDLNCCSANAARGVGQVSDWAVTRDGDTVYINFYEALSCRTQDGLKILIGGDYPAAGKVSVALYSSARRKAALRIPAWSKHTRVTLCGTQIAAQSGEYLILEREWRGEKIQIEFDFAPRFEPGGGAYAGKHSVYCGPVLYGCDASLNPGLDITDLPPISEKNLSACRPVKRKDGRVALEPGGVVLSDFRMLGMSGGRYATWVKLIEKNEGLAP